MHLFVGPRVTVCGPLQLPTTQETHPPAPQGASSVGKPEVQGQETEPESPQPGQDLTAQEKDVAVQDREYIRTWPTQLEQQVSVGSQRIVDIVSVETDY